MSGVLTASQVEAAVQAGRGELAVPDGMIVTPLARDRAQALGLVLVGGAVSAIDPRTGPGAGAGHPAGRRVDGQLDIERLALESKVRIVARRTLLRRGRGVGDLEDLVSAVMRRVRPIEGEGSACGCDGRPTG